MKVETKGHTTTIKETENNLEAFVQKLEREYKTFENQNLILNHLSGILAEIVTIITIKILIEKMRNTNNKIFENEKHELELLSTTKKRTNPFKISKIFNHLKTTIEDEEKHENVKKMIVF